MTLETTLKDRTYPYVEYRGMYEFEGETLDLFIGCFSYKDEKITSLDGDSYSLDAKIIKAEEWTAKRDSYANGKKIISEGDTCLTVWEQCKAYSKEENEDERM